MQRCVLLAATPSGTLCPCQCKRPPVAQCETPPKFQHVGNPINAFHFWWVSPTLGALQWGRTDRFLHRAHPLCSVLPQPLPHSTCTRTTEFALSTGKRRDAALTSNESSKPGLSKKGRYTPSGPPKGPLLGITGGCAGDCWCRRLTSNYRPVVFANCTYNCECDVLCRHGRHSLAPLVFSGGEGGG